MPLAKRIIPTLLVRGRQLVKGERFNAWRPIGHAAQAVRVHQTRGVDEIVLLDIDATKQGRGPDLELVAELAEVLMCPLAVGGGIRSLQDVKALLRAGADKVVIRTAGAPLIREVSQAVGSQAVVGALDVTSLDDNPAPASSLLRLRAATKAEEWAMAGAGELMVTRCEREGMLTGYDIELIREVARAVQCPVIAHGGAGTYEHMREAIEAGADAVAAGAMFAFTDQTPRGAAEYLSKAGIEVRL